MVKTKKKGAGKKSLADAVRSRSLKKKIGTIEAIRTNPFEVKINRQKHNAIGKKLTKYDRGIPGVSRSKAIKKRQEMLLPELKSRRKVNKLVDNRIGESNRGMSIDDKMMERFAKEKKMQHGKAMFNIDDDDEEDEVMLDELTHKGQSLREIENFERPDDSEDDEEGGGVIGGDIVSEAHFGGGILKKKGTDDEQEKSFKERMEEMIAKSKLAKHERQAEKDEVMEMTDKLDMQWRDLHNLVTANKRRGDEDDETTPADEFDKSVNALRFESRGTPTDRLKTEAEIAKIEKEKLEKLEKERIARMRGESKSKTHNIHRSADDLDDGMDYGMGDDEEEEFVAMYKDGKMIEPEDEENGSEEDDASSENEVDEESVDGEDMEGSDGDEEDGSEEDEDEYSDLESDEDQLSADLDEGEEEDDGTEEPSAKKRKTATNDMAVSGTAEKIPYTFAVPGSYTSFIDLMNKYSLEDQPLVLERMIKCNHPSLLAENKDHLVRLFSYLFEYFGDLALRVPVPIETLDKLTLYLYDIAKRYPEQTAKHSKKMLLERQKLFTLYCQSKGGRGVWPFLDLLMYFKLISVLHPTSDYRHEIVTPAMLFASQLYSTCPLTNHRDVAVGLLLTTIMAEYVSFSKALMPECINFLSALLQTSYSSSKSKITVGTTTAKASILLCKACGDDLRKKKIHPFNLNQVIARGVGNSVYNTDEFVLSALWTTGALLKHFISLYSSLPSVQELFSQARQTLTDMSIDEYPDKLKNLLSELSKELSMLRLQKLEYVCKERKKPKVLRMYEPAFDDDFEFGKKKSGDKVAAEKQKLKNQYKKEMKSAVREIKKDRAFIAEQTIKERVKRDAERNKKTNKILADLQGQQHEINMYNKKNKKAEYRQRKF